MYPFLQFIGLRLYYFKSPFNINDFLLLLLAWCDVLLEILSIADVSFAIRVISFLRIIRTARSLKLFKVKFTRSHYCSLACYITSNWDCPHSVNHCHAACLTIKIEGLQLQGLGEHLLQMQKFEVYMLPLLAKTMIGLVEGGGGGVEIGQLSVRQHCMDATKFYT